MPKSSSINWIDIAGVLEQAPDVFLKEASKCWRNRLSRRRKLQPQKLAGSAHKDTEQQADWKAMHDSASEELLYFGKFMDKGEHVQLLQSVKVVKRTAKQIHVIAAYALYCCNNGNNSRPIVWSANPGGGLFGDFYTNWTPVRRYRLLRVSKTHLFNPNVLKVPSIGDSVEKIIAYEEGWKCLCSICLFASEKEYADWHLTRYEETAGYAQKQNENISSIYRAETGPYTLLGISTNASQQEIKAAYKRMAMKYHPDRGGNATKFHKIKMAYDVLHAN